VDTLLKVYGCGGCGINIVSKLTLPDAPGMPDYAKAFIDTSEANIREEDRDDFFLVPGMRGAGGVPKETHAFAHDKADMILRESKPGTMNIIVFGLAGGSGCLLGSLIAGELAKRGVPAICLAVGSTDSKRETQNTINILSTLERMSVKYAKAPIPMKYFLNTYVKETPPYAAAGPRDLVDEKVIESILKIALVCSEKNEELDRQDVNNWVFYGTPTELPPQLVDVIITQSGPKLHQFRDKIISLLSLLPSRESEVPAIRSAYSKKGYYNEDVMNESGGEIEPIFMATTHAYRETRLADLQDELNEYTQVAEKLSAASEANFDDDSDDPFVL